MNDKKFLEIFRFDQDKRLSERIGQILFADLLAPILEKCKYPDEKNYYQSFYEGRGFRLTPKLAPKLHHLCHEVKDALQFRDPVEFFVTNDPALNALSILRRTDRQSHLIIFNSGLIERLSDKELKFVIGHELAHIIFKTAELKLLISNLYPNSDQMPVPIKNLIRLWEKFAEISADRLGFIAAPDLENCVFTFFKLSSGLNFEKVDFSPNDYLNEVDNILEKHVDSAIPFHETHPTNPLRVKAIHYFSESDLYRTYKENKEELKEDLVLNEKMDKLVRQLELHPDNERDYYRLILIAAGGFFLAGIDKEFTVDEEEKIIENLSNFTVYPRNYLTELLRNVKTQDAIITLLTDSVKKLLEIDPNERYHIFNYLCQVAIADRQLTQTEINCLMEVSTTLLGFHETEASRLFLSQFKAMQFRPRF
ncbi:MAG: M48 family metallopeptidase [Calditrichia bacterium]